MWGIIKKYPGLSWTENFLGGHLNIGKKITIYGANAMNWTVNIRTKKWGYVCFTLPTINRVRSCNWYPFLKSRTRLNPKNKFYFYLSPNGTPWASTFYRGNKTERILAEIRCLNFGHGFDTEENYEKLHILNQMYDNLIVTDYTVEKFHNQ